MSFLTKIFLRYRPIWSSGVSVPSWDLGRPYRCSRTPGLFSLYCSDDNVCSCVEISYKNPLQALKYPPTPAPEIKQKTSHTLRRLTSVTTMPSIAGEFASDSSEVNIQKDAAKSGRGCQRYYCMRMSCQDAGVMRMSSFHFTRRYFPEIYVERGHLPPNPRDCARRIRIRIKKWTSCKSRSKT